MHLHECHMPTHTPAHLWQILRAYFITFESDASLFLQQNAIHMMHHICPMQLYWDHLSSQGDICRALYRQCPQFASTLCADLCAEWDIAHHTSYSHYPESNGFAESMIKSVKHTLMHCLYAGSDGYQALLTMCSMLVDAKLPLLSFYMTVSCTQHCWPTFHVLRMMMEVHDHQHECVDWFCTQYDVSTQPYTPFCVG